MSNEVTLILLLALLSMLVASLLWRSYRALIRNATLLKFTRLLLQKIPQQQRHRVIDYFGIPLFEQSFEQWVLARALPSMLIIILALVPVNFYLKWVVFLLLSFIWLQRFNQRRKYIRRALREWPNALDMLSMLMRSGLSFRAAIHAFQSVPNDSVAVAELARVHRAQQSGFSFEKSLAELNKRIPHPWITLFIGTVLQAYETGGSLAERLQQQAAQCRAQQLLDAERRAQEVSVKLLLPLIFCFFPVTMLLILGPVFIGFLQGGLQ